MNLLNMCRSSTSKKEKKNTQEESDTHCYPLSKQDCTRLLRAGMKIDNESTIANEYCHMHIRDMWGSDLEVLTKKTDVVKSANMSETKPSSSLVRPEKKSMDNKLLPMLTQTSDTEDDDDDDDVGTNEYSSCDGDMSLPSKNDVVEEENKSIWKTFQTFLGNNNTSDEETFSMDEHYLCGNKRCRKDDPCCHSWKRFPKCRRLHCKEVTEPVVV